MEFSMWMTSWLGAAALTVSALAPAAQAQQDRAQQAGKFDGTWSVEVVTERGNCDRAYRYSVIVENGRARYGGREQFDVDGQVRPNGVVQASISRGQGRANVSGRLVGHTGRGTWTASGDRACSGYWNAEKRS